MFVEPRNGDRCGVCGAERIWLGPPGLRQLRVCWTCDRNPANPRPTT